MSEFLRLAGGLGLFLLGMVVMTEGLRALAGDALNRVLFRFTKSPLSGALTGAGVTALMQSSSATTVATVGFVSAGLLTFPQALGVMFWGEHRHDDHRVARRAGRVQAGARHGDVAAPPRGNPAASVRWGSGAARRVGPGGLRAHLRRHRANRVETIERVGAQFHLEEAIARLDAIRWLHRMSYHAWRILHHLCRAEGVELVDAHREEILPREEQDPREVD